MANPRWQRLALFSFQLAMFATFVGLIFPRPSSGGADKTLQPDPWAKAQIMEPEELARLLSNPGAKKPTIVCVAFEFLYKSAHIPGAQFIGPGRDTKGLEALKAWARSIARDQEVVLYCGCCPLKECPNIRPAFAALRELGLMHLKVLDLESSFAKDWVEKDLPIEKREGGNTPNSNH